MTDSVSHIGIDAFHFILCIHVAFGTVALIIAPLAMVTIKGGRWHRRWGKIYFWAMAGVALTAAGLCWLRNGLFLFLIAIFSFYLAFTGYRVLGRKNPADRAKPLDIGVALAMILAGAGLAVLGIVGSGSERWVRMVFGAIGLFTGVSDIFRYVKPSQDKKAWLYFHMTRFLGAYIATVTAFSVVNFQFLPYFWRWLWPTILGTIGITVWRGYYARKFNRETNGNVL